MEYWLKSSKNVQYRNKIYYFVVIFVAVATGSTSNLPCKDSLV